MTLLHKSRKSQMEIMGLLIIVILFSLGLLFTIRFMATRERSTVHETFATTELSANMLNAFLRTTSEGCRGADMTDLLRDCAGYPSIDCNDDGTVYSPLTGEADSCARIETDLTMLIFPQTLEHWQKDYLFVARIGEETILGPYSTGGCEITDVGESENIPITTDRGDLSVVLKICT